MHTSARYGRCFLYAQYNHNIQYRKNTGFKTLETSIFLENSDDSDRLLQVDLPSRRITANCNQRVVRFEGVHWALKCLISSHLHPRFLAGPFPSSFLTKIFCSFLIFIVYNTCRHQLETIVFFIVETSTKNKNALCGQDLDF